MLRVRGGVNDRQVLAGPESLAFSLAFLERFQSEKFRVDYPPLADETRRDDALEGLQPLDEVACRNEVGEMAKKRAVQLAMIV